MKRHTTKFASHPRPAARQLASKMMLSHKSSLGTSKAALPSRTPAAMMSMLPVHQRPAAAVRARGSRAVTRAVAESLVSRDDEGLRLRGPQTLVLPTIFARTTGTNNKPVS